MEETEKQEQEPEKGPKRENAFINILTYGQHRCVDPFYWDD